MPKNKEGWEQSRECSRWGGACNFKEPGQGGFMAEEVIGGKGVVHGIWGNSIPGSYRERTYTETSPVGVVLFCNLSVDPSFLSCLSKEQQTPRFPGGFFLFFLILLMSATTLYREVQMTGSQEADRK